MSVDSLMGFLTSVDSLMDVREKKSKRRFLTIFPASVAEIGWETPLLYGQSTLRCYPLFLYDLFILDDQFMLCNQFMPREA